MNLSAVLLAGGESRRMGQDKATVLFHGQPLWCRQLDLLREVSPIEIMISARIDPSWRPEQAVFVADQPPSRGPLSGLAAAMAAMRGTHLLAIAVDMPLMTGACLKWMCGFVAQGRGVVPKIGARAEPLAAIYPHESLLNFTKTLEGQDFSLQRVVDDLVRFSRLSVIDVPESHERLFRSINFPNDIETSDNGADAAKLPRDAISY